MANVICTDSSLLTGEQQRSVLARFAVPRAPGLLLPTVVPGVRYAVHDPRSPIPVPGGLVTVEIEDNGFTAINTTVPGRHIFAGTIERSLINLNGQLVIRTRGVGTASFLGGARDFLNQVQGPAIFNALDQIAANELALFFPGCNNETNSNIGNIITR